MLVQIFLALCFSYLTNAQQVSSIPTPKVTVGFGPVWSDKTQSITWVNWYHTDNGGSPIYRYSYPNDTVYEARIAGSKQISFIQYVNNSTTKFVVGLDHDVATITWDGISSTATVDEVLFSLETQDSASRTSYGYPDRDGRLYVGTISNNFCHETISNRSVYLYTPEGGVVHQFNGTWTTSGIQINYEINKFYHLDTCGLVVTQFDYDPATGFLSNRSIAFDFHSLGKETGSFVPDGMELDTDGNLYVPDYQNTTIYKIDPRSSSLLNVYQTNQTGVCGVELGGPNRTELYFTSGSLNIDVLNATSQDTPDKGSYLYKIIDLGATGQPTTEFNDS